MGQDKKTPIKIDDVEYIFEDMTQEQQELFNHCVDLDRKIDSSRFNLYQISINKQTFFNMLQDALNKVPEDSTVITQ